MFSNIVFIIVILSFFTLVNTGAIACPFSFMEDNYLPISILLFTFTALAIMIATTARIITVVIIIHFNLMKACLEKPSCLTLSLLQSHLFVCKGNAYFWNFCHNGMTK